MNCKQFLGPRRRGIVSFHVNGPVSLFSRKRPDSVGLCAGGFWGLGAGIERHLGSDRAVSHV